MPYIKPERRNIIRECETIGELNFFLTSSILQYLQGKVRNSSMKTEPNYTDYNEIMGVLECIKQELYRRKIAPYENKKCKENGDVY